MRTARFQVYKAKDGWRWRLLSANNRQIAQGEAHTRERDAYRACEGVKKAVKKIAYPTIKMNYSQFDMDEPLKGVVPGSLRIGGKAIPDPPAAPPTRKSRGQHSD